MLTPVGTRSVKGSEGGKGPRHFHLDPQGQCRGRSKGWRKDILKLAGGGVRLCCEGSPVTCGGDTGVPGLISRVQLKRSEDLLLWSHVLSCPPPLPSVQGD